MSFTADVFSVTTLLLVAWDGEFTRRRNEGMSVTEAGRVVGVADNTARRYERTRKAAAA